MVNLNDLQKKFSLDEKKVKIEAWGGEVKIKKLTLKETAEIVETQREDGYLVAVTLAASFALVEPKMSVDDLNQLSGDSFKGIEEINKVLNEFDEVKK